MWTEKELYNELSYVDHSRARRSKYAEIVLNNPELTKPLINILFKVDDKISCRAAWVLEYACGKNLKCMFPFLDQFTNDLNKIHLDPAVRPAAKICDYLVASYYSKNQTDTKKHLSLKHRECITEACFDWMINDEKIAPKAYAMNSLYLLGSEFEWIHPELKIILERDFQMQSSGFKARAKHILKRIEKRNLTVDLPSKKKN